MVAKNILRERLAELALTPETAAALLADRCRSEPQLAEQLQSNPRSCLEKIGGRELPKDAQIVVHSNSDHIWHLPLPCHDQERELSEEQLQKIAAGEIWVTVTILGTLAVGGTVFAVGAAAIATKGFTESTD